MKKQSEEPGEEQREKVREEMAMAPENVHNQQRFYRAQLSRLIEPGDLLGGVALAELGVERLHQLITSGETTTAQLQQLVAEAALQQGLSERQRDLNSAVERWRTRLSQIRGSQDLQEAATRGAGLLIPEDPQWPAGLNDLGAGAPLGLWHRTDPVVGRLRLPKPGRCVAIIGAREATDYGMQIAYEFAEELARHGVTIISGAAYGIDGAAHRGALRGHRSVQTTPSVSVQPTVPDGADDEAQAPSTVAVLACGVDRLYPAGHESLLQDVMQDGLVLSELPAGSAPQRHRFLQRNRIIAALADAVIVIEARHRSGALSTAHHGLNLGRPVGAVPGSIRAASSTGCHRLLAETPTQLITDTADIVELIGAVQPSPQQHQPHTGTQAPAAANTASAWDSLDDVQKRLYDALPQRGSTTAGRLSGIAGLSMPEVYAGLSRLQRDGLAQRKDQNWRRCGSLQPALSSR